jgi:hypothetical protein
LEKNGVYQPILDRAKLLVTNQILEILFIVVFFCWVEGFLRRTKDMSTNIFWTEVGEVGFLALDK